jgi:hypothetical protein
MHDKPYETLFVPLPEFRKAHLTERQTLHSTQYDKRSIMKGWSYSRRVVPKAARPCYAYPVGCVLFVTEPGTRNLKGWEAIL